MALVGAKRLAALGLSPNGWNRSRNFPVFFPVNRKSYAGEQFAQACVHRQRVLDILSPARNRQKASILLPKSDKYRGDRDLESLWRAKCGTRGATFLYW